VGEQTLRPGVLLLLKSNPVERGPLLDTVLPF